MKIPNPDYDREELMLLLEDFQFSQSNLQDYLECPRRFQLRYLNRLAWPAVDVEPILEKEKFLRQGAAFHRILHQHAIGLPVEKMMEKDDDLRRWWHNYQAYLPPNLPEKRYPEITLSAHLDHHRLMAKYDLLALGERAVILDWKTSLHRPPRHWLEGRIQTRLYRYLLVRAGAGLNSGKPVSPQQVEMIYWFANFPDQSERFSYDQGQFEADETFLREWMNRISVSGEDDFHLTDDEKRCRFCRYRSLCERGHDIGSVDEIEPEAWDEGEPITDLEF